MMQRGIQVVLSIAGYLHLPVETVDCQEPQTWLY